MYYVAHVKMHTYTQCRLGSKSRVEMVKSIRCFMRTTSVVILQRILMLLFTF